MKKLNRRGTGDMAAMLAAILTTAATVGLAPMAMAAQVNATGGDSSYTTNGYSVHLFTNVGTSAFSVISGGNVDVLIVGGGGGGGGSTGGGGGAGGYIYSNAFTVGDGSNYTVVVGGGGAGGAGFFYGNSGANSSFGALIAYGGGGGADNPTAGGNPPCQGQGGGSGGGGSQAGIGGTNTSVQGHAGGGSSPWTGPYVAGGGGGAGSNGASAFSGQTAGAAGGSGTNNDISGSNQWYAGGGGGGVYYVSGNNGGGAGGSGIGGNGGAGPASQTQIQPTSGKANTGSGGGGQGGNAAQQAGTGGSGIVIVRYAYNPSSLTIQNGAAPSGGNLDSTQAVITVSVVNDGGSAASGFLFYGTNNAGLNLTWSFTNSLGTLSTGATVTNTIGGLSSNTTYYFMAYATNTAGATTWGGASGVPFKTMGIPGVDNDGGATGIGPYAATLRGTLTNGVSAHVYFHWGTDPGSLVNTLDAGTNSEGAFSASLAGLSRATTYSYAACASNDYGGEVVAATTTNFTTLPYVWITASTNLVESQTNLYNGVPVVVDGGSVVLKLSNSATYGNLPVYQFGNLIVTNGASVSCLSQGAIAPYTVTNAGVAIQSAGDVSIAGNGSSINADGAGFPAYSGPGGAAYASSMGGTHGGRGDANTNATYGSYKTPTSLGSGGSATGGGAIKLIVAGNLVVNGRLSANGNGYGAYNGGGGSGGSIWITGSGTLGGTGEVQVAGGAGQYVGSGGGGGRFAMDDSASYNFHGNIRGALGNQTSVDGSAGTIYFSSVATPNFTVFSNQTIVVGNDTENVFGNLIVYGTLIPGGTAAGLGTGAVIRAANITVATGGAISADGWGFGPGWGPAPSSSGTYGTNGACHGGTGSYALGAPYGSATQPTSLGSGGTDCGGGGAMKLVVTGTLTVNGTVSANGQSRLYATSAPQGAGGSVWIDCGTLVGNGSIRADALASTSYYGSGGGRIAIKYRTKGFIGLPPPGLYVNQQTNSTTVTVKGGYNTSADGPEDGSIYIQTVQQGTAVYFH